MQPTPSPFKFDFQFKIENGIPILNFYDNKQDNELKDLTNLLLKLNSLKDMREGLKCLQLESFSNFQDPQSLI